MEKKISGETVYSGDIITVSRDLVKTTGGRSYREVVHHGGGAGVIAMDNGGEIFLVRQYRYAVGEELIEIPAGKLEPQEEPIIAAERELLEETGVVAKDIKPLGIIIPTCGYCDEKIYVYSAGVVSVEKQNLDEDEQLTVFKVPLKKAVQMVLDGKITDGKTVFAILALKCQGTV